MKTGALLQTGGRLLTARATGGRCLLSLYFIVTERCPNTCTYCGYRDSVGNRELAAKEMPIARIRTLLAELPGMGCCKIHLTGGEPLARPDIGEIASAAKEAGLFVGLSTSGVGLPARIDTLGGVDLAFVSLDGPEEIHNRGRGRADHASAVRAVDLFLERGKRVFTTTVLTRRNASAIDAILDFASRRKILANFVFCNAHTDPSEPSHLPKTSELSDEVLDRKGILDAIVHLRRRKQEGAPVGSSGGYLDYMQDWPDFNVSYLPGPHAGTDCSAGRFFAYLFPDGRLYPCGDLYWRQEAPNAADIGLEKAWQALGPIPCRSCRTACYVEQNLVFGLKPSAAANWLSLKLHGYW